MKETIVAQATAPGRGGIGILRVSGPKAVEVAQAVLGKCPKPRMADYLPFKDADGTVLDQGIALYFKSPNSFTGEDVLELQGHGGQVVLDLLLKRILQLDGVRLARPGEFSEQAFLNDKLDLAQAEAIADLIDATSEQAARSALKSLQGEFSNKVNQLVDSVIYLRTYVEASIDFPDEEIDFLAPLAVASGTPGLLVVALQRVAHRVVDHEAHVTLVDAHAEGVRRNHHPDPSLQPLLLTLRTVGVAQAAVVGGRRNALVAELFGQLFGPVARTGVDDARSRNVVHQPQQLAQFVVRVADAVRKVRPREAAADDVRLGEFQMEHDVLGHGARRRGRQRQHRDARQPLAQLGDPQVGGAEVVAPLRDAVRFVDGQQRHGHPHDPQTEGFRGQPFGRHVEEFRVAVDAVVQCDVDLPRREPRVDRHGRDSLPPKSVDLILHQGDERRDDDAQPLARHRRNLVGEGFPASGGHQHQRVAPLHYRTDDLLLNGAETRKAPVAFECAVDVVRDRFHVHKGTKN